MANTITTNENTRNAMDLNNVIKDVVNYDVVASGYTLSENAVINKFGADGQAMVNVTRFTKSVDFITLERIYQMSLHDFKNGYKDNDGTIWKSPIEYIKAVIEMCGGSMDKGTISAYIKVYTLFFMSALPEGINEKVFDEKVRKFSVTALLHISRIKSGFGSMIDFIMNESPTMTISKIKETIKKNYTPIEVKPRESASGGNDNASNDNASNDNASNNNGNGNGNSNDNITVSNDDTSITFTDKKSFMEWAKTVSEISELTVSFTKNGVIFK